MGECSANKRRCVYKHNSRVIDIHMDVIQEALAQCSSAVLECRNQWLTSGSDTSRSLGRLHVLFAAVQDSWWAGPRAMSACFKDNTAAFEKSWAAFRLRKQQAEETIEEVTARHARFTAARDKYRAAMQCILATVQTKEAFAEYADCFTALHVAVAHWA